MREPRVERKRCEVTLTLGESFESERQPESKQVARDRLAGDGAELPCQVER